MTTAMSVRLVRLPLSSRRAATAIAVIAAGGAVLWLALHRPWNTYGAVQLPLLCEAACAVVIAAAAANPFGELERATGRWLPYLRLATTLALTAVAVGVLVTAGTGGTLAGGPLAVLRNVAGLVGLGLLGASLLGGALAWIGPTTYLVVALYAVYTQWHGPAITSPWLWPARPPHDIGAAICAGLVLLSGLVVITVRGARDPVGDE